MSVVVNYMFGKIICGVCVGVLNVGILGVVAFVAYYREVNFEFEVLKLKKLLIYVDVFKLFVVGMVLLIGGLLMVFFMMLL